MKEGTLYKSIKIDDVEFVIKYGYYEEKDRYSRYSEPIPIYPDFVKTPIYNKQGYPFVTHMQDKCIYYDAKKQLDYCYDCKHFKQKEDLIGICTCPFKRKNN